MAREIHLEAGLWQNLPESLGVWYEYNCDLQKTKPAGRQDSLKQIMRVIREVIYMDLTDRQKEIVTLYYTSDGLTQSSIASLLGISQPTVSQHLNGKKRNGKKIGGDTGSYAMPTNSWS